MRSLYFSKRGEVGGFFVCGVCGAERPATGKLGGGTHVQIGNQMVALVCSGGDCFGAAVKKVSEVLPGSFPELDANGYRVGK